jgi:hypothetical protein
MDESGSLSIISPSSSDSWDTWRGCCEGEGSHFSEQASIVVRSWLKSIGLTRSRAMPMIFF